MPTKAIFLQLEFLKLGCLCIFLNHTQECYTSQIVLDVFDRRGCNIMKSPQLQCTQKYYIMNQGTTNTYLPKITKDKSTASGYFFT